MKKHGVNIEITLILSGCIRGVTTVLYVEMVILMVLLHFCDC